MNKKTLIKNAPTTLNKKKWIHKLLRYIFYATTSVLVFARTSVCDKSWKSFLFVWIKLEASKDWHGVICSWNLNCCVLIQQRKCFQRWWWHEQNSQILTFHLLYASTKVYIIEVGYETENLHPKICEIRSDVAQFCVDDLRINLRIDLKNRFSIFSKDLWIFCFADGDRWLESLPHTNFQRSSSIFELIEICDRMILQCRPLCCGLSTSVDPPFSNNVHNNEKHFLNYVYSIVSESTGRDT